MDNFLYKQVEYNTEAIENKAELASPIIYAISAGTGSQYLVTSAKPATVTDGLTIMVRLHETNTLAATMEYNGSIPYPIYLNGIQIEPGNLVKNTIVMFRFNASMSPQHWEVISNGGGSGGGSGMSFSTTTGAISYEVNIANGPVLGVGTLIALLVHRDSVDGQTINYNGNGDFPLRINDVDVSARQIRAGTFIIICFDGTNWELFSGGNSLFYLGDIDMDDMSFVLNEEKYFIDEDIEQGGTTMSFIGGQIAAFDPLTEELSFYINGVFQVINKDYRMNSDNTTITLIGKTGSYGNVHTYIVKKKIISVNVENTVVQLIINRELWVQESGLIKQEIVVNGVKPSSDVMFALGAGATNEEKLEFSRKGLECIELKNGSIVVKAINLPTLDIPVIVYIMR